MGSVTQKQVSLALSLLVAALLTYQIIYSLSILKDTFWPEVYLNRIALALTAFYLTIIGGWISFRFVGARKTAALE